MYFNDLLCIKDYLCLYTFTCINLVFSIFQVIFEDYVQWSELTVFGGKHFYVSFQDQLFKSQVIDLLFRRRANIASASCLSKKWLASD